MSCLDVMYHQSYGGAHCLPASQAAAAAAYKAAYYHHHHQQRKLSAYSKMQECVDQQQHCPAGGLRQHQQRGGGGGVLPGPGEPPGLRRAPEPLGSGLGRASTKDQPAEAEYLSSRCVLFTYFQGDIGDVVDQHFSRALSQSASSTFGGGGGESKPFRAGQSHASSAAGLWKDGVSLSENQSGSLSSSVWNSASYHHQPQSSPPCLPSSVSLSVHPDFTPSAGPFHPADGALWAGHDTWTYSLNAPQGTAGASYPHVHHDAYPRTHPRAVHVHAARHAAHAMLHSYPAHHHSHAPGHALDPRFSPLLLPAALRGQQAPSPGSLHGSPHSEGIKTEMDPGGSSPVGATSTSWAPGALHGPPEGYDSDQDKAKATAWF